MVAAGTRSHRRSPQTAGVGSKGATRQRQGAGSASLASRSRPALAVALASAEGEAVGVRGRRSRRVRGRRGDRRRLNDMCWQLQERMIVCVYSACLDQNVSLCLLPQTRTHAHSMDSRCASSPSRSAACVVEARRCDMIDFGAVLAIAVFVRECDWRRKFEGRVEAGGGKRRRRPRHEAGGEYLGLWRWELLSRCCALERWIELAIALGGIERRRRLRRFTGG